MCRGQRRWRSGYRWPAPAFFGDRWLGGHRNGTAGLNNPNTPDIQRFVGVYAWLGEAYGDGHLTDDTRWYTNVPAI